MLSPGCLVARAPALVSLAALGLLAACAGTPPAASPGRTADALPPQQAVAPPPSTSSVHISDEIRTKCGIPDADAYFQYNSAYVRAHDHEPLDLVAKCFTSGPLAGHAIKLVGRADPRGQSDYNMTLGQWRADSVEKYLTSHGMRQSKEVTTSRGAMDAIGTDEATWQHDRRVDVMLGD